MTGGPIGPGEAESQRASQPFDPGLQPERTNLAWRRTALALVVAAIVGIRAIPSILGAWAIVPAGTGLLLALGIFVASHQRYKVHHHRLTSADSDRIALPGGGVLALVAITTLGGGLAALVVAVVASR